jgi:AmmeMemoRadiSam system protein B/AmmeMemoRadiSam system protein A
VTRFLRALIRQPAVAGMFYPAPPGELASMVDRDLSLGDDQGDGPGDAHPGTPPVRPKALIVPHAGYVYSGPVAGRGYRRVAPWRHEIRRVVVLGPAHRVAVAGMAVTAADSWDGPLGPVAVDQELRHRVAALDGVVIDDRPHAGEHSVEVHVPFLQRLLDPGFTLLPIVVGHPTDEQVATVLEAVWGGDETLLVASTDLSHYHDYATARDRDHATAENIVAGRLDAIGPYDACGAFGVRGLLLAAGRHGLQTELVDLRSSGDTAGSRDRVVGYGAFVLTPVIGREPDQAAERDRAFASDQTSGPAPGPAASTDVAGEDPGELTAAERSALVRIATEAVRADLEGRRPEVDREASARLREPGASFVTLRDGERLLGCIGSMEAHRALADDVADNARGAAFRDPRLPPLTRDEFARMSVHVSVLTAPEPLPVESLDVLRTALRPGVDGLLIEAGRHRGTFLPSVWEQLPRTDEFLSHLWRKAGLTPGTWPPGMRVSRYGTVEFGDDGPRPPITRAF